MNVKQITDTFSDYMNSNDRKIEQQYSDLLVRNQQLELTLEKLNEEVSKLMDSDEDEDDDEEADETGDGQPMDQTPGHQQKDIATNSEDDQEQMDRVSELQ